MDRYQISKFYLDYIYDQLGRLQSLSTKRTEINHVTDEAYTWDEAGNLSNKTVDGVYTSYGYDLAHQLISESRSGYGASYTYDHNGNRLTRTLNGILEEYTYDDADKLLNVKGAGAAWKSFTYDAMGNTTAMTTSGVTRNLNYDWDDRVTSITAPSYSGSYLYNAARTRVSKTVNGSTRTYLRDGVGVTAPVLSDGTRSSVPGISERIGTQSYISHSDYLGTVTKQTDRDKSQTHLARFDAFGVATDVTNPSGTQKGFAANWGYQEDDNGLKQVGHRLYDPELGRFLQRDRAQDGRNWYVYCEINPVNSVDPSGLNGHTDFYWLLAYSIPTRRVYNRKSDDQGPYPVGEEIRGI